MAIAKFLQVSDIHTGPELLEAKAMVDLANSVNPDAVLFAGDLFDGIYHLKTCIETGKQQEKTISALPPEQREFFNSGKGNFFLMIYEKEKEEGNLDNVKNQIEDIPEEQKEELFAEYKQKKHLLEDYKKALNAVIQQTKSLEKRLAEHMQQTDSILSQIKAPIVGVRGNHDIDFVYGLMKSIEFIDIKSHAIEVKGIKIAGAPNTYETIEGIPPRYYQRLSEDIIEAQKQEMLKEEGGEKKYKELMGGELPLLKRLKNAKMDLLLTHKGLHEMATGPKDGQIVDFGYGLGLEKIVKEKKPAIILGGHVHGTGLYTNTRGYQGIRSSDERAYVLHVDTGTKKVVLIDIYQRIVNNIVKYKQKN